MAAGTYDVIVVGARVAGSATALLLARRGLRVLVLERARFPSDTLSTHQVQAPGVERLRRWGLLDRLRAAGTPAVHAVRLDLPDLVLTGRYPAPGLYSPRRTVLDATLVDAARAAGAEVRENVIVEGPLVEDGRVAGVRARRRGGPAATYRAGLVVGADGKHSTIAAAVGAGRSRYRPAGTYLCYSYWSGLDLPTGELYLRPDRAAVAFPTNDGLSMVAVIGPVAGFTRFRSDTEAHYLAALDGCGDLGERVRAALRAERYRATSDLPNAVRVPHGRGWALVGDAGLVLDPITAQGISNGLRDADLLADAVTAAASAGRPLDARLATYRRRRDGQSRAMYGFTVDLARLGPPRPLVRRLFMAMAGHPEETDLFLAAFAGSVPLERYARHVPALLGGVGTARAVGAEVAHALRTGVRRRRAPAAAGADRPPADARFPAGSTRPPDDAGPASGISRPLPAAVTPRPALPQPPPRR